MKMMRKNWKDRKGVSPVIATILMVAITVVLAAVLYVMVMGFGGDSAGQAPTVSTTKNVADKRIVVSINEPMDIASFKIKAGDEAAKEFGTNSNGNYTVIDNKLWFIDAGGNGKIDSGDYFHWNGATEIPTGTYDLIWTSGESNQVVTSFTI